MKDIKMPTNLLQNHPTILLPFISKHNQFLAYFWETRLQGPVQTVIDMYMVSSEDLLHELYNS